MGFSVVRINPFLISSSEGDGFGNRIERGPSVAVDSKGYRMTVNSAKPRPLLKSLGLIIDGYHAVAGSVVKLLLWFFPLDITRFIVSIIIDSSKRMQRRWSWSYMCKEFRETSRIVPFGAHPNSPASVITAASGITSLCANIQTATIEKENTLGCTEKYGKNPMGEVCCQEKLFTT